MSRIDVQTLVLAFESALNKLNKNPPEAVSDAQISSMLISCLKYEIENHFSEIIKQDIHQVLKKEFKKEKTKLIKDVVKNILLSSNFRQQIEEKIRYFIIQSIK